MSVRDWQEKLYPDLLQRDPVARFRQALYGVIQPGQQVLDVGAGAGEESPYDLKGRVGRLLGVDRDPRVGRNPLLHEGVVGDAGRLPFAAGTFDLAFSIYVLEHVQQPGAFAREIARVLKPGGLFLALTPNRFHYVALIAALTPMGFHKWINRKRGRKVEDTFPTCYRLNSPGQLKAAFVPAGMSLAHLDRFEVQPNYLMFSTPTFLMGALYERIVNRFAALAWLRVNLIACFRKGP